MSVVWVRGQSFGLMGSPWCSWAVGFVVPQCWCWALYSGCHWWRGCVVVVVVDGREEEYHML